MKVVEFKDGIAINVAFPDAEVLAVIRTTIGGNNRLIHTLTDPPFGKILDNKPQCQWDKTTLTDIQFAQWMVDWTLAIQELSAPNSSLYVFGGIGKPNFRPFYRYLVEVESQTKYKLANHITWGKKRAYGLAYNYLYTREELAYLHLGEDIRKPLVFNIPLLSTKRPYKGFNLNYPAKSEFYRRTNIWTDVNEIFSGKIHECQKPIDLLRIPIETHTNKGDWVFDPFAGSGSTAMAAREVERKFIVIEKDDIEFEKLVARLNGTLKAPK